MRELMKGIGLYEIDGYSYIKPLTGGKASTTLLYRKGKNGKKVIVKMLIAPRNESELQNFQFEAEALSEQRDFVPKLIMGLTHHAPYPVDFYMMEFIDGITLETHIKENPFPWPWKESIEMLYRISFALSRVSMNFVHRDLHVGNIMLVDGLEFDKHSLLYEDPGIRILDFGCNKNLLLDLLGKWDNDKNPQDKFRHFGALSSWSPEFIINPQKVGSSHDSWALGVILYRFLTGKYPIYVKCFGDFITALNDEHGLENKVNTLSIPLSIRSLLLNLLSFDPEVRFWTGAIGDMCADLLYRNLVDRTETNESFLKKYMDFGAHIHQCAKCSGFVGRHHSKCPSCGTMLNIENCIPVL